MSTSTSGGTRPPSPRKGVSFSHDVEGGTPQPMTNGGNAGDDDGGRGRGRRQKRGGEKTTSRGGGNGGGEDYGEEEKRKGATSTSSSSSSVPLICLSDGIARKADVISLSSWVALMLTLDGRDKITKTVQYTCRLIGWYYENLALSHGLAPSVEAATALAVPYRSLQKTLTNSRKAFRLGRFLIEFQKLRKALPGIREGVTKHPVGIRVMDSLYSFADGDRAASRFGRGRGREDDEEGDGTGWITGGGGGNASSAKKRGTPTTPLWKSVGISCKLLGLAGFWAGDNLFFLTGAGFFPKAPKDLKARAQRFACRSYFFGAVVGLFVNLKEVRANRPKIRAAQDRVDELVERLNEEEERVRHLEESETGSDDDEASAESFDSSDDVDQTRAELEEAVGALREARERQFVFCVALLKSCCDTMVFSNMPGVDLHRRYRGRKMNEGFQCLCGLTSASTVLYNNFPNRPKGSTSAGTTRRPSTEERRRSYRKRNFASSNWYAPMS